MKRKVMLWLAVLLAVGSLSGCSCWKSSETEENVETMEEISGISGETGQLVKGENGETELKTQKHEATIENLRAEYIYNYPSTK